MALQQWIDKFLGRGQVTEGEGAQECRGDGGTSCYRPNVNKRTVMAKMPDDKLTGQMTLAKLKALTVKQETGNFRPVAGANQNTGSIKAMRSGYTGNVQPIGNGYTGSMASVPAVGYQGNMQDSGMHTGYTGRMQGMHSGFTGMEPAGGGNMFVGDPGNGVDAAYGYNASGVYQNGGGYAGNTTNSGYSMNGYAAPSYTDANGWNGAPPDNIAYMPQDRMGQDTHVERVMVLTSMKSCYDAIGHMKDGETLILSLDCIADRQEAERWKYLLQGAAFTLKCTMMSLPGSSYMMLVAPNSVTMLRDDDRGERDIREEAANQARVTPQETAWQGNAGQAPRRTRRASSANANWNNYETGNQGTDNYYGRQPTSADGYGSYGGYGY